MKCGSCNPNHNNLPADILAKTQRHPCYSEGAHHRYARMHLPVAPKCNISCNYCNRKFDCLHESRPGVTSAVLTPEAARNKFVIVKEKIQNLSVVGIAGPGDALANWENTRRSIELIREADPETVFCLSTNGLMLPDYAGEIIELGINHVTVTVNCLETEIGAKIYRSVTYKGKKYQGTEGAALLIQNQLAGVEFLARSGVLVKVNIVMIQNINDSHIPDVVKKMKSLGVFMTNIMPLIPAGGSVFENFPQTSMKDLNRMRNICQLDLHQMRHCKQCRADAIGLLGDDRSIEFSTVEENKITENPITHKLMTGTITEKPMAEEPIKEKAMVEKLLTEKTLKEKAITEKLLTEKPLPGRVKSTYKIAVASKHGILIDQHFGHCSEFLIYQGDGEMFELIERRSVGKYCRGVDDCDFDEAQKDSIADALKECDAVLTLRIGYQATKRLEKKGIMSIEHYDTVEQGLIFAVQRLENKEAV